MTDMIQPPRYAHKCPDCEYLGRYKRYDLYFDTDGLETVVARYGSNADDVIVGVYKDKSEPIRHAFSRAKKAGLV